MTIVFLGLGTNIEPREDYLTLALEALDINPQIEILKKSSIYETAPVGYLEQKDFLNMVIKLKTQLDPLSLLGFCQEVEQKLNRKRTIHWGPRTIDIDILLYYVDNQESKDPSSLAKVQDNGKVYKQLSMATEQLTIPHPRMLERAFVLVPLKEIEPELIINGTKITELIVQITDQDVRLYQGQCPS